LDDQTPHGHGPPLRVVMVSTYHEQCGIATYTEALVPHLEALGAKLFIVSPYRQKKDPGWGDQPKRFWHRNRAFGFEALGAFREVKRLQPSVVHLQVNRSLYSSRFMLDFAWLCQRDRIPLVATLHGRYADSWGEDFKLWRLLFALRHADLIVHTRAHCSELKRARVHVIPHGIAEATTTTAREARTRLGLDPNATLVTHFGFLVPDKGVDEVLQAVATLRASSHPDLKYRVAGAVYGTGESARYFKALTRRVAELAMGDAVEMTGEFLSDERLALELQAATLIVLNYRTGNSQGASGAVRRALSSGRPVAVSGAPVFDDVREAVATLRGSLVQSLSELLSAPDRLREVAERGRLFCEAQSWTRVAGQHLELYRKLAADRAIEP
jgi:glycosyltransferase involved in cell wall biosynthesis